MNKNIIIILKKKKERKKENLELREIGGHVVVDYKYLG